MREKIYYIIEAAREDERESLSYDRFMILCIIASVIPLCFKETNMFLNVLDKVTVVILIVDYILRWGTADMKLPHRGKLAFLIYPFTPFAIVDLLSILPSVTVFNTGFKLFKLFRLSKAFRAFKLLRYLRYSRSFNKGLAVIRREKRTLSAVCIFAGGYIFLSALVMFQVEPDSFNSLFDAIYWAVVTLTTVGYGDIHPVSVIGKFFSMLSSFVGIAIVALPTSIITAGYVREWHKESK